VALAVIEPGDQQTELMGWRIPHELMHVMMYRYLGEGYDHTPAWLREGFATLVEANPTPEYDNALSSAAALSSIVPFVCRCARTSSRRPPNLSTSPPPTRTAWPATAAWNWSTG
jgi:predicted SprT family Zn-dependent metalloprotease